MTKRNQANKKESGEPCFLFRRGSICMRSFVRSLLAVVIIALVILFSYPLLGQTAAGLAFADIFSFLPPF